MKRIRNIVHRVSDECDYMFGKFIREYGNEIALIAFIIIVSMIISG